MIVRQYRRLAGQDTQAARHPEVQDQAAALEIEHQIFRAPAQVLYALAIGEIGKIARHPPAQPWLADDEFLYDVSYDGRLDTAPRGFDFWKFRHWNEDGFEQVVVTVIERA
jgi:hypothetical protein